MTVLYNFIPVLLIFILTLVARIQQKSWVAPGPFFLLITTLFMAAPILLAPNYYVWDGGLWWILACAFVLYIGSVIGTMLKGRREKQDLSVEFINSVPFKNLKRWTLLLSFIGFIGLLYYVRVLGLSFRVFLSFDILGDISSSISNTRYTVGYSVPAFYNLALAFNYLAGFLGGMLWVFKQSKIAFIPFMPIILTTALTTTKSVIIFITIFWIGGFLASRVLMKKEKIFTPKLVMSGLLLGVALNVLFIVFSMLRYNILGFQYLGFIYQKLTHYYFGYLSAFTQWFRDYGFGLNELTWGNMTLAGVWDVLGIERSQGVYDSFTTIDYATGKSTNIYSLYRFLAEDFGLAGTLILMFVIGFFMGFAYKQVANGRIAFMPFLMLFYAQVLFSNTTSILTYNTLLFAVVGVSFYVIYASYPKKRRQLVSTVLPNQDLNEAT